METGKRRLLGCATLFVISVTVLYLVTPPASGGPRRLDPESFAKNNLSELTWAVNQFRLNCDRYPTTKEGLEALKEQPKDLQGWHGPYLQYKIPVGPDDQPYRYRSPGPTGHGYEISVIVNGQTITRGSEN